MEIIYCTKNHSNLPKNLYYGGAMRNSEVWFHYKPCYVFSHPNNS